MIHKKYSKNIKGRDFVIGDLHGCYQLFCDLLNQIQFDKDKDRMFSVGDLIDRGDRNIECLRLIKEPWFHAVLGNHEDMLISHILDGNDPYCWDANGGMWHYDVDQDELSELAKMARELPYSMTVETETGDIGICHAQPPTTDWNDVINPDERKITVMLWARMLVEDSDVNDVNGVNMTIHGHTPVDKPKKVGNSLFIDTGAVFTGNLASVQL